MPPFLGWQRELPSKRVALENDLLLAKSTSTKHFTLDDSLDYATWKDEGRKEGKEEITCDGGLRKAVQLVDPIIN